MPGWSVAGVKYIASVSFGKDSLAMLLKLLNEKYPLDAVVFYNTGMEFNSIYQIRDRIREILPKYKVEFVELVPDEPFLYSMLERKIKYRYKDGYHYGFGWCGGACRWGTSMKISAIKKYKKSLNDTVIDYVGIAADELMRFEKAKQEGKVMPLVTWGMSEQACLDYCHNMGYWWLESSSQNGSSYVDLYSILDNVSCWCCRNKNKKELSNIYHYLPDYWNRLRLLQSRIKEPMKKWENKQYGKYGNIFDMERVFIEDAKRRRGKYD